MSKFSEKCRQYLNYSGMSVYQFSRISGLERTTLHRMVTGARLPAQEFVKEFCSYVRINAQEAQELMELYYEEKVGSLKYQNRKYIKTLLEHIAELEENPAYQYARKSSLPRPFGTDQSFDLPVYTSISLQTQSLVYQVLEEAFACTNGEPIYTNVPAGYSHFFNSLYSLYYQYQKEMPVVHLMTFLANPQADAHLNYNLEKLYHILPMALSPFSGYVPYYTYSKCTISDLTYILWPYYLVTSTYVLELSPDLDTAILHRDAPIVNLYRRRLEATKEEMHPLIQYTFSPEASINFYREHIQRFGHPTYTLEASPCILWLMPPDEIQAIAAATVQVQNLESDIDTLFMDLAPSLSSALFSEQGLTYFCSTGKLPGQIASYFPAIPPAKRKECLTYCLTQAESGGNHIRLIRPSIKTPLHVYIELCGSHSVLFAQLNPCAPLRFCLIRESSITEAFYDFFASAQESGIVLSQKQTIKVLREFIEQM